MWPFKKNLLSGAQPSGPHDEGTGRGADEGFGAFAPLLFVGSPGYLQLLNLVVSDATEAISLVVKCCASVSNPYHDIRRLLGQTNWRSHLVGAVAVATLAYDTETSSEVWGAIDRGSWVTPQLAAAAFLRDPMFADHAPERLRSGCPLDCSGYSRLSAPERHIATGPGGAAQRSAKMAASLVRLLDLLPQGPPHWLTTQAASADLRGLLAKDFDSSGQIAEQWLTALNMNLPGLRIESI